MLAPAPAAGLDEMSRSAGKRMFPNTSPTRPPANAVTKHHTATAASASACSATRVEYQSWSLACGSLPWGKPCFPHEPPFPWMRGNLPLAPRWFLPPLMG